MKEIHFEGAGKAKGMLKEFKAFAMRGNVVDLAVGVVIGAAFGKIVTSLVADVITPVIGFVTPGGADLKNKFISLEPAKTQGLLTLAEAQKKGAVIAYGQFCGAIMDFIIVAFCIFLIVKLINKLHAPPPPSPTPPPPPEPTMTEKLLVEIRDTLKAKPNI
jgi:large conductance mechanosensitive channel